MRLCVVEGCQTTPRITQFVCDCCRKKYIRDAKFRLKLRRQGIIPD